MWDKVKSLAKKHWKKAVLGAVAAALGLGGMVYFTEADGSLKMMLEELLQKFM